MPTPILTSPSAAAAEFATFKRLLMCMVLIADRRSLLRLLHLPPATKTHVLITSRSNLGTPLHVWVPWNRLAHLRAEDYSRIHRVTFDALQATDPVHQRIAARWAQHVNGVKMVMAARDMGPSELAGWLRLFAVCPEAYAAGHGYSVRRAIFGCFTPGKIPQIREQLSGFALQYFDSQPLVQGLS